MKKEKNKMTKFDYKKWVTSYKTNKKSLFEQNITGSITGSNTGSEGGNLGATTTFYQDRTCGPCNNIEGLYTISGSYFDDFQGGIGLVADNPVVNPSGQGYNSIYFGCGPVQLSNPVEVPNNMIPNDFGPSLTSYDIPNMNSGEFNAMFGSYSLFPEDYTMNCAGDQFMATADVFSGVCCDPDALNYGQTNVPTLNIQFAQDGNHLDTALMLNQFNTAFCDNSLCSQGVVPDAEDEPTPNYMGLFGKDKDKLPSRRRKIDRRRRRLREVKKQLNKIIKKRK